MTWKADAPQGDEVSKIRFELVPYTVGKGLDLGCGPNKLWPTQNCIGVDNYKDTRMFNIQMKPDVFCDIADLSMFAAGSMDWVFSSHALEHFDVEKVPGILREWFRVLREGKYLSLYLPDASLYPNIGQPGGNQDHKFDPTYDIVVDCAERSGARWDLIDYQLRGEDNEYSGLYVFKKLKR